MSQSPTKSSSASADVSSVSATTGELLLGVVQRLVSQPDRAEMKSMSEGGIRLLMITVAPEDLPAVTGENGRTARSLRAIVDAISSGSHERLELDIQTTRQAEF
jgi:predicted RNA-binding protein YlqC (UPF0109 family)